MASSAQAARRPTDLSSGTEANALRDIASLTADEALARVLSRRTGLTAAEVEERREQYGKNEVAHERPPAWYVQLGHAFVTPFTLVLVALAALSFITGDQSAAYIIATMVALATLLRFTQEFRSTQAAQALRAMVRTSALVERTEPAADGAPPVQRRAELPIEELVPGDIVYLAAGDMIPADVRLLTAKDVFVSQSSLTGEALPVEKSDVATNPSGAAVSLVELSTLCFMGTSVVTGAAVAVVASTGTHTIFGSLAKGLVGQRAITAFDIGVSKVSWLLIRFMAVMVPVVFLLNGLTKGNWLEAFLFGLAVAVGLTPEMLPMIVSANLAKGAMVMSRRKVIVKRLNSIQNFGAMDTLCTDKTGTLTQDRIILEQHLNVVGEEEESVLHLAYLNSFYQTGLRNLLDVAILEHGELHDLLGVDTIYTKLDEIPFDFSRRRMSVVVERNRDVHELICKGAVEEVIAVCTHIRDEDRVVPIDDDAAATAHDVARELNEDGLRVVAVAYREFPPRQGPFTVADESQLVLAGFVAFLDPPKDSAAPALEALRKSGVRVKILTGDNDVVTKKVCRDVGLDPGKVLLGSELAAIDDHALEEIADGCTVFAKLTPADKTRVVQALRRRGHTVGYMGDGINDAGALRAADVGISVDSAVDIAKESADIILLEKSLMVLEDGVIEGRKTFGNIIKYIKMTASSNFGNVFSVLAASAFLPFLPMLPVQLLTQNLLYDISQITIPFDDLDTDYLLAPRKWSADDIGRFMLFIGPISSVFDIVTFLVMWFVFRANAPEHQALFQAGWFIEGLLSQTLIVHMIRTAKIPFVESRASWPVLAMTAAVMVTGIAIPFVPLGHTLGFASLPGTYFVFLFFILLGYVLLTQAVKRWYIRKFASWL